MLDLAAGIVFLTGVLLCSTTMSHRLLEDVSPSQFYLGVFVIGSGVTSVISAVTGFLGLFTPVVFGLLGTLLTTVALGIPHIAPKKEMGQSLIPDPRHLSWSKCISLPRLRRIELALGTGVCLGVALAWIAVTSESLAFGINRQDSLWYHLPLAAEIAQSGSIGPVHQTDPLAVLPWYFPQNVEVFHALGMTFLGTDLLSVFLSLIMAIALLLSSWCIGHFLGNSTLALVSTGYLLTTPLLLTQAGTASNDLAATVFLLASIGMLYIAYGRVGTTVEGRAVHAAWFISGLAGGLAIGTKLSMLIPAAILFAGVLFLSPRGNRSKTGLSWFAGSVIGGGFWYIRNLIVGGTPLPWIDLGPLNGVITTNEYPREPFSISDYFSDPGLLIETFPFQLEVALGPTWPLILSLTIIGLLLPLVPSLRGHLPYPRVNRWVVLAMFALLAFHIVAVPVSASGDFGDPQGLASNLRYVTPAFLVGMIFLVETVASRLSSAAVPLLLALAIGAAVSLAWDIPSSEDLGALLIPMLLILALVVVLLSLEASRPQRLILSSALVFGVVGLFLAAENRYTTKSLATPTGSNARALPPFVTTEEWATTKRWVSELPPTKIGIVGPASAFGQYDLYGRPLKHHVAYLGKELASGGFRPVASCGEWVREVNATGSQFLIFTQEGEFSGQYEPREAFWTRLDPAAVEIGRGNFTTVFLIRGRLNPKLCRINQGFRTPRSGWGGRSPVPITRIQDPPLNVLDPLAG